MSMDSTPFSCRQGAQAQNPHWNIVAYGVCSSFKGKVESIGAESFMLPNIFCASNFHFFFGQHQSRTFAAGRSIPTQARGILPDILWLGYPLCGVLQYLHLLSLSLRVQLFFLYSKYFRIITELSNEKLMANLQAMCKHL